MSRRTQLYVLGGLLVLLLVVFWSERAGDSGPEGVLASDAKFLPLSVEEPQLRLDLLEKLHKLEYSGTHRNIFSEVAPPPVLTPAEIKEKERQYPTVPVPPPLPPVDVPAQFFGYAAMQNSGKRVAFFLNGEDVLVVEEGSVFLSRFRLDKIGNDTVDVEETSTSRHVSLPMVKLPNADQPNPGNQ
jgi:hypothetical protein